MINRIVIGNDNWEKFRPISLTRPVADLRCGAFTFLERIKRVFPMAKVAVWADDLVAKAYTARHKVETNIVPSGDGPILYLKPSVIIDPGFAKEIENLDPNCALISGERIIGALVEDMYSPNDLDINSLPKNQIKGKLIDAIWDLVNINGEIVDFDYTRFFSVKSKSKLDNGAYCYNESNIYLGKDCHVFASAVLDASEGPIIIDDGAEIRPGTAIEGPCYIGQNCLAVSGWLRPGNSFGPYCRFGGEIESSVFQAYSNKYHEGFVGHSYIGEWVNLGALTTTSDLKNNYGEIRVNIGEGQISTGRIKIGSMIGDHSKTGIGALLNSGTYLGVNVNHYGIGLPPKHVPSFSWGTSQGYVDYDSEKAIQTAKVVMTRRSLEMLPEEEALLRSIFSKKAG